MKFLSIILGAVCGGYMWRCRGETGWGSSWGLYSVGLMLLMLIWLFYGNRKGFKFELIPFGAFLMGLAVTGYGTVIDQLGGVLYTDPPYLGENYYVPLEDYKSGGLIIFIMACTFVPLFAFFVGSLFSGKDYKFRDYVAVTVIFFGVSYIMKIWPAHIIFRAINPEQYQYAALGLKEFGIADSPYAAYMKHFAQRSWCDDFPLYENYYMSVEHISDLVGLIAVICYPLIKMKDKVTPVVTFVISIVTGFFSTVFSLLISANYDRGVLGSYQIPEKIASIFDWGIWEYMTGFTVGFITMLCAAVFSGKCSEETADNSEPVFKNRAFSYIFNLVLVVFILGITPARVFGLRFSKMLMYRGYIADDEPLSTILVISLTVVFTVYAAVKMKKNILDNGKNAFGVTPLKFCYVAFPAYLIYCALNYFITNRGHIFNLPYDQITGIPSFFTVLTAQNFEILLMIFSTIILICGSVICIHEFKRINVQINQNKTEA